MTSQISPQFMPLPAGEIHFFRLSGDIEQGELIAELRGMFRLDAGFRSGKEKSLDAFVPKAQDHSLKIVLRNATLYVIKISVKMMRLD